MRVLIIGNFYAPEETGIAPYTTGLAEHMAERGHDVAVVTGLPSYPQWRVYPEYRGVLLGTREVLAGVEVRRVRGYVPRRQSALRRGLYESSFLVCGLTALAGPRPDVLVGVVPALSGGVLARIAASRFGCPYALVFQDLTGPAASQSGVAGGGWAAGPTSAAEGWVARGAAAIGIIAEGFRPYFERLGIEPGRIHRVRNWVHIEEPRLGRTAIRRWLGLPQGAVVCLHAGNMGFKQGLTNIVECARLAVEANPHLLFVLMGDGNQRSSLVELAQRYQLPNLRFLPIQPAELFSSVLAAADVLLVNQRGSVTSMSLPSKLTSYLAAGRPVIAALSPASDAAQEIRDTGTGVVVPPDQPDALLNSISEVAADLQLQTRLSTAAQEYAKSTLTAEQALAGLESMVEAVVTPAMSDQKLAG
jgi:colanic acid biosynthesis glycosyl transferase WcaI